MMEYVYDHLKIDIEDGVGVITLNRPEKLNPIGQKTFEELWDVFKAFRVDPTVRVVVLTGAGRAFSAGGDMADLSKGSSSYVDGRILASTMLEIVGIEKPVICAINGLAVGGGAGVALACDLRFASETAQFSEIYAKIGMVPDCGNLWLLPRVVGPAKAKELCFTAETIDAAEMCRLGIVEKVFPPEDLMPKTMEFAKELAAGPTLSYQLSKALINRSFGMSLEQFFDLEALAVALALQGEDLKEGVSAFLEKRRPQFK
jgi:2-(1,2-epoxy-1,2-dihydrophenyl)acetyl-CoA isomerase